MDTFFYFLLNLLFQCLIVSSPRETGWMRPTCITLSVYLCLNYLQWIFFILAEIGAFISLDVISFIWKSILHLKSYPQRVKHHSRKWAYNANAMFKGCVLVKSFSYIVYMRIYVQIYEELISKTWSLNLALALRHQFLDWCLTRFGKEVFILGWHLLSYRTTCIFYLWLDWMAEMSIASISSFGASGHSDLTGSNPDRVKIYTCHFIARCRSLLRYGNDNVTECDIRSWCWCPGLPVAQHYKVVIGAHCHRSVPVLIWP